MMLCDYCNQPYPYHVSDCPIFCQRQASTTQADMSIVRSMKEIEDFKSEQERIYKRGYQKGWNARNKSSKKQIDHILYETAKIQKYVDQNGITWMRAGDIVDLLNHD